MDLSRDGATAAAGCLFNGRAASGQVRTNLNSAVHVSRPRVAGITSTCHRYHVHVSQVSSQLTAAAYRTIDMRRTPSLATGRTPALGPISVTVRLLSTWQPFSCPRGTLPHRRGVHVAGSLRRRPDGSRAAPYKRDVTLWAHSPRPAPAGDLGKFKSRSRRIQITISANLIRRSC